MARILMIEDNLASQKLLGDLLLRVGHDVTIVDNAADGLSRAAHQTPDLIIMDVSLPGMDGLTATRTLRAEPIGCTIPILAVTAERDGRRPVTHSVFGMHRLPCQADRLPGIPGEGRRTAEGPEQ